VTQPLTEESQGSCRWLVGNGAKQKDLDFSDAEAATPLDG